MGGRFPQIVDRESGNLYQIYPQFSQVCLGGGGVVRKPFFMEKQFFLISCFLRVFMLFPTFFENNYFAGMGGGGVVVV